MHNMIYMYIYTRVLHLHVVGSFGATVRAIFSFATILVDLITGTVRIC